MPRRSESASLARLELEPEGFALSERLLAYEMVNSVLLTNIEVQRHFAMRPLEFQIFLVIAIASVQRFVREAEHEKPFRDATPLPLDHRGAISRRRIAETLDLPLETVRRQVAQLIERGEVIEVGRGRLATGGGTLRRASLAGCVQAMSQRYLRVINLMLELEAARVAPSDRRHLTTRPAV